MQESSDRPVGTVFVTGATGVVGRALLDGTALPVVALTHRGSLPARAGLRQVRGDVTAPRLGLTVEDYASVHGAVDVVVHAAATTAFDRDPRAIHADNVAGTRGAVELARLAGAPLVYVSSAFVARAESCRVVGGTGCADGRDAYLASKLESEALVRAAGIPYAIVRPSLLVGDSRTGEIARHQGLHTFLGAYCTGALPFLPFAAETAVDFVPSDVVVAAIERLVRGHAPLGEYWLTSGAAAMRAEAVASVAARVMGECGRSLPPPRFFPLETVQRLLLPAFFDTIEDRLRRRLENLVALASLFDGTAPFPSDLDAGPLVAREGWAGQAPAVIERTVRRFWAPDAAPVAVPDTAPDGATASRVEALA